MTSPHQLSRRRVLGAALASGVGLALAGCGSSSAATPPSPRREPPVRPLAIPPLAPSTLDASGRRRFDLVAAAGATAFRPGVTTPTWGYGGLGFGGPTLRARRGEQVTVRVTNRLDETTTTHWHGMTLPAHADGGPHQPIAPGATWEASWQVDQPAATLWYHPHPHGATERHIHRGLTGMFLLDEQAGPGGADPALPHRYGVDDIPVIVTDRSFTADGRFDTSHRNAQGLLGDTVLVNGTIGAYLDVTTERVRLRLLNASPARSYRFALDGDGPPLTLVGTDVGLLATPRPVDDVLLTPGERAEVVLTVEPGRSRRLRSLPHDLGALRSLARATGGADTLDVLAIRPAARLAPAPPLPSTLTTASPLDETAVTRTRRMVLGPNTIDDRFMDMSRIDQVLSPGATEIWELHNRHTLPHNLHIHDARMQVLEPGPDPTQRPWKDTVLVPPGRTVRVLLRVGRHTDPWLPYMYHCHLLRHEDNGMMGQFLVMDPGSPVPDRVTGASTGHAHG